MAFTNISDFVLDQIVAYQDMNELKNNIVAVKEFPKGAVFGGNDLQVYTNIVYQELIRQIYNEVDGTNIQGCTYELWFMGQSVSGTTVTVRLFNVTDSTETTSTTFNGATLDLRKSSAFVPITGNKKYRIDVRGTSGHPYYVYGVRLIQR